MGYPVIAYTAAKPTTIEQTLAEKRIDETTHIAQIPCSVDHYSYMPGCG